METFFFCSHQEDIFGYREIRDLEEGRCKGTKPWLHQKEKKKAFKQEFYMLCHPTTVCAYGA